MGSFGQSSPANSGVVMSPIQGEKKRSRALPVYSFTWFDVAVVLGSMGTYLADILTDILVTSVYWKLDENIWAALTLMFLLVPSVIMQIFSTRWYVVDGHRPTISMFIIHLVMMGPIKRYIEVLRYGLRAKKTKRIEDYQAMYSNLSDVSMLRLFESFLESAPQLVLQLYIMIKVTEDDHILTGIAAFFSLISLAWAIAAYTKALRIAAYSQDSRKRRVSYSGLFLQTLWRVGMVAGRIVALVLCATIYPVWILVGVGIHWFLMTVWLVVQDTDFCSSWWEERLFNCVVGVIHIFCFFNMKEGKSRWRMTAFYVMTFVENTVMVLLWYPHRTVGVWYNIPAMFVVWGGFIIGLVSMITYYRFFHPSSSKKCHCCMLYYHMTYICCSCHDETTFQGTPYRRSAKMHKHSSEFEFGSANSYHEQRPIFFEDIARDSRYSMHKDERKKVGPCLTSTPGDDISRKFLNFGVKSLDNVDEYADQEAAAAGSTASSTTVDFEKASGGSCVADSFDMLMITPASLNDLPGGNIGPCADKGNSTMVRDWVKKTQNIYEPGNETSFVVDSGNLVSTFGTLRCTTKDERDFMQVHFGNLATQPSGQRNILRMKSFNKKERLSTTSKKLNQSRTTNLRNTFREAFGFHTFDKTEKVGNVEKVVKQQPKTRINNMMKNIDASRIAEKQQKCQKRDVKIVNENDHSKKSSQEASRKLTASTTAIIARIDQPPELSRSRQVYGLGAERGSLKEQLTFHSGPLISQRQHKNEENEESHDPCCQKPVKPILSSNLLQESVETPTSILSDLNHELCTSEIIIGKHQTDMKDEVKVTMEETPADYPKEKTVCLEDNKPLPKVEDFMNLKNEQASDLFLRNFGPVIQLKGNKIMVQHLNEQKTIVVPNNAEIAKYGSGEQLRSLESVDDTLNSILRNSLKASASNHSSKGVRSSKECRDEIENLHKHGIKKLTEDSHARKRLHFTKTSSKTYNLEKARKQLQKDCKASFRTRLDYDEQEACELDENCPVVSRRRKNADGLSNRIGKTLLGAENCQLCIDGYKSKRKNRTSESHFYKHCCHEHANRQSKKRKLLSSIENKT